MDIVEYTENEIRKNLALIETHLKQAPFSDRQFCQECIQKHILILEGLCEEGLTACIDCDIKKFEIILKFLTEIKEKNFKIEGIELAKQVRKLRKNFIPCDENLGMKDRDDIKSKIQELEEEKKLALDNLTKERLEYGKYLLNWVIKGRKCSDV